jgi:hypothetical protein
MGVGCGGEEDLLAHGSEQDGFTPSGSYSVVLPGMTHGDVASLWVLPLQGGENNEGQASVAVSDFRVYHQPKQPATCKPSDATVLRTDLPVFEESTVHTPLSPVGVCHPFSDRSYTT